MTTTRDGRLEARLARWVYASGPYGWTLGGPVPDALAATPLQPWSGDARRGALVLKGGFTLGAQTRESAAPWDDAAAPDSWRAGLHGFGWLADLHAVGSDAARRRARELAAGWIGKYPRWDAFAWRADILAERVTAWIAEHEFFCASADDAFRRAYFRSLSRQARHLFRAAPGAAKGAAHLGVVKALVYAAVALPTPPTRLQRALDFLDAEIARQILADGAHVERNPASHLQALRTLTEIRSALTAGRVALPPSLQATIDRMAGALRAYRHGDGGLALFNGANEGEAWLADAVLAQAEAPGRAPEELRHAGFQRLRAGRTLLIVDAGAPAPSGYDDAAHAGTLSFEMGVGKERLIVNCGARSAGGAEWASAQRATAAHSTLALAGTNSSEIRVGAGLGRRPRRVECRRESADGATLLDLSHDGYRDGLGAIHRRRLYLSADGHDLRGEDMVAAERGCAVEARFHLHPSVSVSALGDGASALLRLPSGEGWRFHATGGRLAVAESIYLGRPDDARRTEQIVLAAEFPAGGGGFKWALRRVGAETD